MAAAVQLRADFLGDDLPRTARKSEEADQTRQLLALPVILDGGSRREAARTGGGGLQVMRDRVLRFNAVHTGLWPRLNSRCQRRAVFVCQITRSTASMNSYLGTGSPKILKTRDDRTDTNKAHQRKNSS